MTMKINSINNKKKSINMKISDFLQERFFLNLSGKLASGKTSLAIIIANEIANKGKKVLFITCDDSLKLVQQKFIKANKGNVDPSFITLKLFRSQPTIQEFEDLMGEKYDLIVFDDGGYYLKDSNLLEHICNYKTKISFITTTQNGINDQALFDLKKYRVSDLYINLENKKFSLYEKIKYFIKFWKIKPNKILSVLKSRYDNLDRDSKINLYLNIDSLNYNIEK